MDEKDWTGILGWPGYKVYRHERNEGTKELKLWVRRKRGNKHLVCSTCGKQVAEIVETYEREVRDLPWSDYKATVVVELYRVRCPDDGVRAEKVLVLPSNAPFSKRSRAASWKAFGEMPITFLKIRCKWVGETCTRADNFLRESGSSACASMYRASVCIRSTA